MKKITVPKIEAFCCMLYPMAALMIRSSVFRAPWIDQMGCVWLALQEELLLRKSWQIPCWCSCFGWALPRAVPRIGALLVLKAPSPESEKCNTCFTDKEASLEKPCGCIHGPKIHRPAHLECMLLWSRQDFLFWNVFLAFCMIWHSRSWSLLQKHVETLRERKEVEQFSIQSKHSVNVSHYYPMISHGTIDRRVHWIPT